ncbi:MAG: hypothetical protein LBV47_01050, partial [Bacteroidales bacterium]|nr:hypothetical protein [Bacteroidales bacterium]
MNKIFFLIPTIIGLAVSCNKSINNTQILDVNESISKIRKGELVIQAKPGVEVTVEQLSHE